MIACSIDHESNGQSFCFIGSTDYDACIVTFTSYSQQSVLLWQASSGPGVLHPQPAHPGTGPVPTAAPMPSSPALDSQGRQHDSSLPVRYAASVVLHSHLTVESHKAHQHSRQLTANTSDANLHMV